MKYKNIREIHLSYYVIELEVLFSRNPFLLSKDSNSKEGTEGFSFIKPNLIETYQVEKSQENG